LFLNFRRCLYIIWNRREVRGQDSELERSKKKLRAEKKMEERRRESTRARGEEETLPRPRTASSLVPPREHQGG
jgi:hypothetical protein